MSTGLNPSDVGLEIRIGHSARESAQTKGRRYLVEGRILIRLVTDSEVRAQVRGREIYTVEHAPGRGWSCTCPARGRCAHRLAVAHVVARGDS